MHVGLELWNFFVRAILLKDKMHVGLEDILLKSEKVVITSGEWRQCRRELKEIRSLLR